MKKTIAQKGLPVQAGFSLIELLVVIAVLGMLATFVIVRFTGVQLTAVDTKRQSELRQYQNALEIYATKKNSLYPPDLDVAAVDLCGNPINLSISCAQDPKVSQGWKDYWYQSNVTGTDYVLYSQLERTEEFFVLCSDGQVGKMPDNWTGPLSGVCPL